MKKILSISLILLLLVGQLGITFGTHYCMGLAVESGWMIGEEDMSCGMASMETSHPSEDGIRKDCCDNEYVTLESVDIAKTESSQDQVPVIFVALTNFTSLEPNLLSEQLHTFFTDSSPPPPDDDLLIRYQTFRI